jgi:hypothetical protein
VPCYSNAAAGECKVWSWRLVQPSWVTVWDFYCEEQPYFLLVDDYSLAHLSTSPWNFSYWHFKIDYYQHSNSSAHGSLSVYFDSPLANSVGFESTEVFVLEPDHFAMWSRCSNCFPFLSLGLWSRYFESISTWPYAARVLTK